MPNRPAPYQLLVLLAAAAMLACASAGSGAARPGSNVLTAADMADFRSENVYSILQRLRPDYLRGNARGATSLGGGLQKGTVVYVDRVRYGTTDVLRTLSGAKVREVRYYTATEAAMALGTNNSAPVIAVTTQ
ncbi:MAG: hypothetical protein NVS1B4_17170 [Gemmatimonadaceae bacterium]